MNRPMRLLRGASFLLILVAIRPALLAASQDPQGSSAEQPASILTQALEAELERSFTELKDRESEPLYFLAYRATDSEFARLDASFGALISAHDGHSRRVDVEARVGSPELDNTHQIRGQSDFNTRTPSASLPLEDSIDAIRAAAWRATDVAYKAAIQRLVRVKTNETVKVEAEDTSDDFSHSAPGLHLEEPVSLILDTEGWKDRLRRLSDTFNEYPFLVDCTISLSATADNRIYLSSEGTRLRLATTRFRIFITGQTIADDGMQLALSDSFEAPSQEQLPDDATLEGALRVVCERLGKLRTAPIVEPFAGPAIIMNRATGVFFHEIFGHRIEGHRQKNVDEGQTFTKKVGQEIMPGFFTIHDDPNLRTFGDVHLNGHFQYDDEGVPAQDVTLVKDGVLMGFLMSRSPIANFPVSNGHGRCDVGHNPVSRQGNLVVSAKNTVPFDELRGMLLAEIERQQKPYGLIFHDISGGYTTTQRSGPQAFKVVPLYVVRVYADGRPDEVVRGVDLVGTPLASITKMIQAADDDAVFNGNCGAESGWVPVSAIAPSVLVSEIEIEKKAKSQERPPLLSNPVHETLESEVPADSDEVVRALEDELQRSMDRLRMDETPGPYLVAYTLGEGESYSCSASFGAINNEDRSPYRNVAVQVRVGDYEFDNTNYSGWKRPSPINLPREADYSTTRHHLWLATDALYKRALQELAAQEAWLQTNSDANRPDDLTRVEPVEHLEGVRVLEIDEEKASAMCRRISAVFKDYPAIHRSQVRMRATAENRTLLSSEGFRVRNGENWVQLRINAGTQAEDGMPLGDAVIFYGRNADDLPAEEKILEDVRAMATRLSERAGAARAEEYIGPVLFEGDAAGLLVLELLVRRLSAAHEPLAADDGGSPFKNRLNKRVAPKFLDVVDDPNRTEYDGTPLLGAFEVDHDGVRAQSVGLVSEGRLKAWFMSRIPTRALTDTNGHSRGGYGGPGCVFVESTNAMDRDALREELIRVATEQEMPYGLRVESLARGDIPVDGARANGSYSKGSVALSPAVSAYRVYLDGHEEPIRGGEWQGVTLRSLRDIFVTGQEERVVNTIYAGNFTSLVTPSLLVEELEMKKPAEVESKPPYLIHPAFAGE